ncbi:PilZ domain-containing protein [uncultured Sphingomonas sp.]|uniref:PilZ domain-containing protein n=1 Tax=uncultured Sphingomonas sp. TaxID=158754 RepID=UPI0025DF8922|nr:PilZ domain-containing protein [uncultured Sphingomonas sp.]
MPLTVTAQIVDDDSAQRAERKSIDRASTLRVLESRPYDAHVENLSATGCLLSSSVVLSPGMRIRLGLSGGGVVEGTIIRQLGKQYGCEFLRPLTSEQMQAAFGTGALVHGRFASASEATALPAAPRWPRSLRAAVMIGLAVLAWVLVLATVGILRA